MRAEIWSYDPLTDIWDRVLKAPMIIGSHGKPIARDISYRSIAVFQPSLRGQASPVCGHLVPRTRAAALDFTTEDGRHFEPTCEPGLVGLPVTTIRALVPFKGRMYTTPAGSRGGNTNVSGHAVVYESRDPAHGGWEPVSDFGFGDTRKQVAARDVRLSRSPVCRYAQYNGFQLWRSTCDGNRPTTGK